MVGREFAVKKSIRPFKGENDRNQKLREVANWTLLMNSSAATSQQPFHPTAAQPISSARDHLHVVRCYDAWEEEGFLYMQSELFRSGTARHFLDNSLDGPMEEDLLWLLLLDLARGLRCLHNKAKLIHLDLKWDNCFIVTGATSAAATNTTIDSMDTEDGSSILANEEEEGGIVKIGDFGLSVRGDAATDAQALAQARVAAQESSASMAFPASGSAWNDSLGNAAAATTTSNDVFIRPEIAEGDQTYLAPEFMDPSLLSSVGGRVTTAADIFSLGLMLFEVAFDVSLPRRGESWIDLRNERIDWSGRSYMVPNSFSGSPPSSQSVSRSPELVHLMQRMLRRNPAERPSIDEVLREPTLVAFARGERGAPQRAALRALPPLLPPASKEVREQALHAAKEQQAAVAAATAAVAAGASAAQSALLMQPDAQELEAELMANSHSLRATRSRSTAAAMRAAAAVASAPGAAITGTPLASVPPTRSRPPSLSGAPTNAADDSLAPKNLFSAFDAADDD
jgi:serine/threonine protein kinase